jgi:hypothetical protein
MGWKIKITSLERRRDRRRGEEKIGRVEQKEEIDNLVSKIKFLDVDQSIYFTLFAICP